MRLCFLEAIIVVDKIFFTSAVGTVPHCNKNYLAENFPQKIDHEMINMNEFQDRGPLVMQARMRGRIKHALDDEKSFSLKEVQFDTKHNEIFTIGSDVEKLEGMSQMSMLSGEKSAEVVRAKRNATYLTMASEVKRQEEEERKKAREAERTAENERRMAECAARRRAKEEQTSAKKEVRDANRSDDAKSEKTKAMEVRPIDKTQKSAEVTDLLMEREKSKHYDFAKTSFPIGARKKLTNEDRRVNSSTGLKVGAHRVDTKPEDGQRPVHFQKPEEDDESSKSQTATPSVGTSLPAGVKTL
uniref:SKIP_SNW domain-containing protein n=1 Tax=Angiostrongylus cantonensis TaxID=6313 RepID=A0A0K0CU35_ANGCA